MLTHNMLAQIRIGSNTQQADQETEHTSVISFAAWARILGSSSPGVSPRVHPIHGPIATLQSCSTLVQPVPIVTPDKNACARARALSRVLFPAAVGTLQQGDLVLLSALFQGVSQLQQSRSYERVCEERLLESRDEEIGVIVGCQVVLLLL